MRTAIALFVLTLAVLSPGSGQEPAPETTEKEAKSEWRASKRGPVIELTESGDVISATVQKNRRYLVTYELKKTEDGSYKGIAAEEFSCRNDHFCRTETPMLARRVDGNRIEGSIFGVVPPRGIRRGNRYCDTCGKSEEENATWMEFVWVREDE